MANYILLCVAWLVVEAIVWVLFLACGPKAGDGSKTAEGLGVFFGLLKMLMGWLTIPAFIVFWFLCK